MNARKFRHIKRHLEAHGYHVVRLPGEPSSWAVLGDGNPGILRAESGGLTGDTAPLRQMITEVLGSARKGKQKQNVA